jgi:hypothetical protein
MKHPFIVFGGAGLALILGVLVWIYFFLFYVPAPTPVPNTGTNPFGSSLTEDERSFPAVDTTSSTTEETPRLSNAISVATTRVVAGASKTPQGIRFVEAGTGHVFEVSENGAERRISNTTLPRASYAVFAPSGTRVAVRFEKDGREVVTVGTLGINDQGERSFEGAPLPDGVENVDWNETGDTLFYTTGDSEGTRGIQKNMKTGAISTLFTVPLRQIRVLWNPTPIIVTKPAGSIDGYAYTERLEPVTEHGVALTGAAGNMGSVFSHMSGGTLSSWILQKGTFVPTSKPVVAEKCAVGTTNILCAVPSGVTPRTYPDSWHRGEVQFDDTLMFVDIRSGAVTPIGVLRDITNKKSDVRELRASHGAYIAITTDGQLLSIKE